MISIRDLNIKNKVPQNPYHPYVHAQYVAGGACRTAIEERITGYKLSFTRPTRSPAKQQVSNNAVRSGSTMCTDYTLSVELANI